MTLTKDFFYGGRAEFTIANEQTQRHQSFRIVKSRTREGQTPVFFVIARVGEGWLYLGKVENPEKGEVVLTQKSFQNGFKEDSLEVRAARWFIKKIIAEGLAVADYVKVQHCGRCGRCGRALTHPESLETGIGPECARRIGQKSKRAREAVVRG